MRLDYYFKRNSINITGWCKKAGVSRPMIYKIMSGWVPDFRIATLIHIASDGHVTYDDLSPDPETYSIYLSEKK